MKATYLFPYLFIFQAVEFLAEWSLTPGNVAFLRVQTGVFDPRQIGDKPKWFADQLQPIRFAVWDDGSSLNGALRQLQRQENQPTGKTRCLSRIIFYMYIYFISTL